MKVSKIKVEHNNQILELDLLVPLSLDAVESIIKKTQLEIQKNRQKLADYETQLRKEYQLC